MAKLFKIQCTECGYTKNVLDGSTRSLVDEYFTVSCDACCNIETRKYTHPDSPPATGWWGRKKRQKAIDDRYAEVSAQWSAELDKRFEEALRQPCSQCGEKVHRVNFGDPFIDAIPVDIGCPSCKQFGCMTVCLQGMFD